MEYAVDGGSLTVSKYVERIKAYGRKRICIFGAGNVGKILYKICNKNGIIVDCFCVTDISCNVKELNGLPVFQFDRMEYDNENTLFLVGVHEKGEHHIIKYLRDNGVKNVIDAPGNVMDYDEDGYWLERKKRPALEITPKIGCSIHCRYCPQDMLLRSYFAADKKRTNILSVEDYKKILGRLPENTLIEFAGFVEPFLNQEAVSMMKYTFEQGFEATLATTLVGLSEAQARDIIRMPFLSVILHIPDKYGYANIPLTDEYFKCLQIVMDARRDDNTPFVTGANSQGEIHPDVIPIIGGRTKVFVELYDRAGNLDEKDKALEHAEYKTGSIFCERADDLNHFILLPDGTVVLCCNDFGMQHVMGNLLSQTYEDIMRGEPMRYLKRAMKLDDSLPCLCRKCIYAKSAAAH